METKVCEFNKFGFCKFNQSCRKRHVDKLCEEENCKESFYENRHPKHCRYYSIYKRCKFGDFCRFKHSEKCVPGDSFSFSSKIELLENTIVKNKNDIDNLIDKVIHLENMLREFCHQIPDSTKDRNNEEEVENEVVITQDDELIVESFSCEICEEHFMNILYLTNHMKTHDLIPQLDGVSMFPETRPECLKCDECGMEFSGRGCERFLAQHKKEKLKNKRKKERLKNKITMN